MYRCSCRSVEGLVHQVSSNFLRHGFIRFVSGYVKAPKDPSALDVKMIRLYDLDCSDWARSKRKRDGLANVHYIRHDRFFVIFATMGRHDTLTLEEGPRIRSIRKAPLVYGGYSISQRRDSVNPHRWRAHVSLDRRTYGELKSHLLELALHRRAELLAKEFWELPFQPYAPIRRQLFDILRAVNRRRRLAGYEPVEWTEAIRMKKRAVKVYQ